MGVQLTTEQHLARLRVPRWQRCRWRWLPPDLLAQLPPGALWPHTATSPQRRLIVATLLACLRHLDAQKRHRCSECRRTGHDVRTCPRRRKREKMAQKAGQKAGRRG